MENNKRWNWSSWLWDLSRFCGAILIIGTLAYYLFGIRFVTKEEWEMHITWSQGKEKEIAILNSQLVQTNERILTNLEKLNIGIDQLNARMVRVETKIEMR